MSGQGASAGQRAWRSEPPWSLPAVATYGRGQARLEAVRRCLELVPRAAGRGTFAANDSADRGGAIERQHRGLAKAGDAGRARRRPLHMAPAEQSALNLPTGSPNEGLSRGRQQRTFAARRLPATTDPLVFHDELQVITALDEGGWCCSIPELETSGRGATEDEAITTLANMLREEAQLLLRAASHRLNVAQRERKGLLLGSIDVIFSNIAESLGEHTWLLGQIEVDAKGERWFREVGGRGERYPFASELPGNIPDDRFLRMAKVHAGAAGEPVGPVVELGPPLDDDPAKIQDEWERLREATDD
jgi:hypothetical protein